MLTDVHCHLTAPELLGCLSEVIKSSIESGLRFLVTSGLGYEDCLRALEISDYKFIYPSLGIAPYDLEGYEEVFSLIERERDRIVAVGEVGLDFWRGGRGEWDLQRKVFEEFIELAKSLDIPIVVHSRSAGKYAIEMLLKHQVNRVIMHAFDGRASYALKAAERGFMFSVPPSIARSPQKQRLVKVLSLDNMLLESDAPVLAPILNEVNYPKNVKVSAEWISRLKEVSFEKVVERTYHNAVELFEIRV